MKINRYKKVHRTLKFYSNHFGFRKPYQVLLDGTICVAALKNKINIHEQFTKYLEGNVKLLTTQCIVNEVEKLGSSGSKALFVLKNFGQHCCNHAEKMVPAAQCIMDMVQKGNQSRYIIATQDRELQGKCRRLVGVPLMYFHLRVPTLEAPSDATQKVIQIMAKEQFQSVDGKEGKEETVTKSNEENEPVKKKRKHKGGPNPLSCKKKKKQIQRNESAIFKENKKKKRKHCSRLVKKIRNEVLASISTG